MYHQQYGSKHCKLYLEFRNIFGVISCNFFVFMKVGCHLNSGVDVPGPACCSFYVAGNCSFRVSSFTFQVSWFSKLLSWADETFVRCINQIINAALICSRWLNGAVSYWGLIWNHSWFISATFWMRIQDHLVNWQGQHSVILHDVCNITDVKL